MKKISYILIMSVMIAIAVISSRKIDYAENTRLLKLLYENSNDTVSIDTSNYILETYLFKIPDKHALVALIYLVNPDNFQICTNISTTGIYVVNNNTVWTSSAADIDAKEPKFRLSEISTFGPGWDTEIFVDVIAEITINSSKNKYLVIARHQYFEALNNK
ncbi:MAG: hypothetical protein ACM3NR_04375 [Methanosarcina sp.]